MLPDHLQTNHNASSGNRAERLMQFSLHHTAALLAWHVERPDAVIAHA